VDETPIKSLRGCDLSLDIDDVLIDGEVFSGHDQSGTRYLIVHTASTTWLCAPVTDRALNCVASNRADIRDVLTHSATGLVERLTIHGSVVCQESLMLCRELTDNELPQPGLRLGPAAP
jgi:hypothetical protein